MSRVRLWFPSFLLAVALMGASWTAETVPSVTWGPTWTVPIRYKTIRGPTIIKRLPPDPARVRELLKELLTLCDQLSQESDEREECRSKASEEAARWE